MKGKGTLHNGIKDSIRHTKGKFYAVFIDFTKTFDLLDRTLLIRKLESLLGVENPLTTVINNIMTHNNIRIRDGNITSSPIVQTNGVLQGDPLSPLLFIIAIADVTDVIKGTPVEMYIYADDIVIGSSNKTAVQEVMDRIGEYVLRNGLTININKTVQMVFRKGGKLATTDNIRYQGVELKIVNAFKYLVYTTADDNILQKPRTREIASSHQEHIRN